MPCPRSGGRISARLVIPAARPDFHFSRETHLVIPALKSNLSFRGAKRRGICFPSRDHIPLPLNYNQNPMPPVLDPDLRRALAERVRYCHEMGIYDFYQRAPRRSEAATIATELDEEQTSQNREELPANKSILLAPVS